MEELAMQGVRAAMKGLARNRRRRIRQQRYVLGSRMMGLPYTRKTIRGGTRRYKGNPQRNRRMRNAVSTVSKILPVRVATTLKTNVKPSQRVQDTEQIYHLMRAANTDTHKVFVITLNPSQEEFFPRMASIARQYTRYSMRKMAITWQPNAGSAMNGRVCLCFVPQLSVDSSQYTSPADFTVVPGAIVEAINGGNEPRTQDIPLTQMNKGGSGLYIDDGTSFSTDQSLQYMLGTIVFMYDGLDSGTGPLDLGTISISYDVILAQPRVDNSSTGSVVAIDAEGGVEVINGRGFAAMPTENPFEFTFFQRRSSFALVRSAYDQHVGFKQNGVQLEPALTLYDSDTAPTHEYRIFSFKRVSRMDIFSTSDAADVFLFEGSTDALTELFAAAPKQDTTVTVTRKVIVKK